MTNKQPKNLSLDSEAVRRGERYSQLHHTNLSKLVSNFLSSLPLESEDQERRSRLRCAGSWGSDRAPQA
jgi:hypothetical protein